MRRACDAGCFGLEAVVLRRELYALVDVELQVISPEIGEASGFAFRVRKSGDVEISHHGRQATVLRGKAASGFVAQVSRCAEVDAQQLMARVTGNYKRGNERLANSHARNRT